MKISISAAAKQIGVTRQAIYKRIGQDTQDAYIVKNEKGKWCVDTDTAEWQQALHEYQTMKPVKDIQKKNFSEGQKTALKMKGKAKGEKPKEKPKEPQGEQESQQETNQTPLTQRAPEPPPEKELTPEQRQAQELGEKSYLAKLEREIYLTQINHEKAKQQQIVTLERKKEIAPISLVHHFFSFAENLIQRLYRRPHEIGPQLSALYLAHEDRKAEQLLVRELEGIVINTQKELLQAIKEEGYKYKYEMKRIEKEKSKGEKKK